MKRTFRKITAMFLVVSMVTSMVGIIPAGATSNPSYDQILGSTSEKSNPDNYQYLTLNEETTASSGVASDYDVADTVANSATDADSNATDTDSEATVSVEKTIEGTSQENEFEITLTVTTTDDITTLETYPDAAVVLLMDTSISMQYNVAGKDIGWPNNSETARMDMARESANSFLESFISNAGDAERLVSLVTFDREATTVLGWTDAVTADGTVNTSVTSTINNLDTSKFTSSSQLTTSDLSNGYALGDYRGGTNMEAGLMAAEELVEDLLSSRTYADSFTAQENVYVVLLSDGAPTWYMNGNTGSTGSSNSIGTYTTKTETESAATSLKQSAMLYTIAFAEGSSAACYTNSNNTSTITVSNWLGNTISSNISGVQTHFDATTGETLTENFQAIAESIARKASAWIVTDPMGQHIVLGEVTSENETQAGEASYSATNNTIVWNLRTDESCKKVNDVYTYTLTYTITLNTDASTFVADTYYLTNGVTSLTYCFVDGDALVQESDLKTIYFNIPAVQGEYPVYTYYVRHLIQTGTDENGKNVYEVQATSSAVTVAKYTELSTIQANFNYEKGSYTDGRTRVINRTASDMPAAQEALSQFKNTVTITENGQYLDFYYDLIPTSATVYHNYYDVTNTDSGSDSVLNETLSTLATKYENGVFVDDDYTAATAETSGYTLVSVSSSDGTLTKLNGNYTIELLAQEKDSETNADLNNIVTFNYEKIDEQRTNAYVTVEHVYIDYVWEINANGRYELVAEPTADQETVTEKVVTKYTGDAFTATADDKSGVYTQVSAKASPSKNFDSASLAISALSEGNTTITITYTSEPQENETELTSASVVHQYYAYKTYINDQGILIENDRVLEGTVVDQAVADDTWYVGETLKATADEFYSDEQYDQVSPDKDGMSLELAVATFNEENELTNNTIVIEYERDDNQLKDTTVTVKHFYTLYTQVIDPETGEVADAYDMETGYYEESFPAEGNTLYAGEFFKAEAVNKYSGKNYGVTGTSLADNSYILKLAEKDNVIEIYYELTENLGAADLTVTHTYTTYLQTYVNGSLRTTPLAVEYGKSEVIEGVNGERVDFDEVLEFASQYDDQYAAYYEDGLPGYTRTDSNDLYATLRENYEQQIDLTYARTIQAYDPTSVTVNHIYTTYVTTVNEEGKVVVETEIETVEGEAYYGSAESPLYAGMGYTASLENREGFLPWILNKMSIILETEDNVINLYYYGYANELELATVQVIHHYTTSEYVLGADGQPTTNVISTSEYKENVVYGKFAGQFYSAKLREQGFDFLADLSTDPYTNVQLVAGKNEIHLYYEKVIEETFAADLEVYHVYTTYYTVGDSVTWENPTPDYTSGWSGQTVSYAPDTMENAFDIVSIVSENNTVSEDPYSVVLAEGENVITIYYEKEEDNRTPLKVTVNHYYTTLDLRDNSYSTDGADIDVFTVYLEDGEFSANLEEIYNELSYVFQGEDGDLTIELNEEDILVIDLGYLRTIDTTPTPEPDPTPDPNPTPDYDDDDDDDYDDDNTDDEEVEDPDQPVIEIPDEEIPLSELPEEPTVEIPDEEIPLVEIPDEEIPLSEIPQTGDDRNLSLLMTTALLSAAGLAFLVKQELDEKKKNAGN